MTAERRVIRVTGHVQGVNFRRTARREAVRLSLSGFARNEPDGSVNVDVEGGPVALQHLIDWRGRGPEAAVVDRVDIASAPLVGHRGFRVE